MIKQATENIENSKIKSGPPPGWKETTLGQHIKVKHGYAFKGEYFSENANKWVVLTPGNFNIGGGFKAGKHKYYIGEVPEEYVLNPNDLIITMTDLSKDGDTLGYPALIPYKKNKMFLHNQRLGKVEFISEDIDKRFLFYLMSSRNYQRYIVISASGSTVRHTSPSKIQEYTFLLPPLAEQKAIAAVLSSFDDKIELLREQNKTLEATAQAMFKEWFIDFRAPGVALRKATEEEKRITSKDQFPEGWQIGKLRDICLIFDSKRVPLSASQRLHRKGKYPYYGATEVMDYIDEYLFEGTYLLLAEDGSVMDSLGYSVLQYVTGKIWVNNHAHVLQGKDNFSTEYLCLLFKRTRVTGIITGAVQLKINQENLLGLEIVMATGNILNSFNSAINPIFRKIISNSSQIQALSKILDILLSKLIIGKVRVNESQEIHEYC